MRDVVSVRPVRRYNFDRREIAAVTLPVPGQHRQVNDCSVRADEEVCEDGVLCAATPSVLDEGFPCEEQGRTGDLEHPQAKLVDWLHRRYKVVE